MPYKLQTSQLSFYHVRTQHEDVPLQTREPVLTEKLPMLVPGLAVRGEPLYQPRLRQEQHVHVLAVPPSSAPSPCHQPSLT